MALVMFVNAHEAYRVATLLRSPTRESCIVVGRDLVFDVVVAGICVGVVCSRAPHQGTIQCLRVRSLAVESVPATL